MSETYCLAQNSKYHLESDMIFIEYDKANMSEIYFIFALDRHMKNYRQVKFRFLRSNA